MVEESLELAWDDVAELLRINPLASEQLKNIVLRRKLAEAEQRLAAVPEADEQEQEGATTSHA